MKKIIKINKGTKKVVPLTGENLALAIECGTIFDETFSAGKIETVRSLSKKVKKCKTTTHLLLTEVLEVADIRLYNRVRGHLNKNLEERAIRGGEATKQKALAMKSDIKGVMVE